MGVYNILKTKIECPNCKEISEQQVDLYFGYRNEMLEFKIGDKYVWKEGKEVQNGGRPTNGNLDGEGYFECENCDKDFGVKVLVRDDRIQAIKTDLGKVGFKVENYAKKEKRTINCD